MIARQPLSRQLFWWTAAVAWWTLSGFASSAFYRTMEGAAGSSVGWGYALVTGMTSAYLWVPLTVLAFWLAERFPLGPERWPAHLVVHLLAGVGVCFARAAAVVLLNPWVGWYTELPPFDSVLTKSFANNLFFYWMLTGVAHAVHYAQRSRQREVQLAEARLGALKAQIHPHFLFNTLNAIASFVHRDPDTAERMITRLSDLLRATLEEGDAHEVALEDELATLRAYLEIEEIRFGDRLRVVWDVEPDLLDARVPHLLLQPLAENAIRHGIAPRGRGGTIEIRARRDGDRLRLEVRDDGIGLPAGAAAHGFGVGLGNVRARLRQLYGGRQQFEIGARAGGGVHVAIRLPLQPAARRVGVPA